MEVHCCGVRLELHIRSLQRKPNLCLCTEAFFFFLTCLVTIFLAVLRGAERVDKNILLPPVFYRLYETKMKKVCCFGSHSFTFFCQFRF